MTKKPEAPAPLIGWYSQEADEKYGHVIYSTPDGGGARVTGVYPEGMETNYLWPDKVRVGEVVDFISENHKDEFMRMLPPRGLKSFENIAPVILSTQPDYSMTSDETATVTAVVNEYLDRRYPKLNEV